MPEPRDDETQEEFISRCIPIVLDDGTAEGQDQAIAVCHSLWEQGAEDDSKMKPTKAQEHKTLPFIVTKIDGVQGVVEHTVAVMGNVDLGDDRIHPGAFTKTITERAGKIRVLDAHNDRTVLSVIGKPLALWEVGKDLLPTGVRDVYPDATGALMAKTQFLMDTPEGRGAFIRIRDGAVDEYSIGYDPLDVDYTEEGEGEQKRTVRNLRTIRLWEYSPVPFAMNPATSTVSAKQDQLNDLDANPTQWSEEDRTHLLISWIKYATGEVRADLWRAYVAGTAKEMLREGDVERADPPRYVGAESDQDDTEEKAGRVFSGANIDRIRGAIDSMQQELTDLELMLESADPPVVELDDELEKEAPAQEEQVATGQDEDAEPVDQPLTSEVTEAEIDEWIKQVQRELSEET